MTTTQPTRSPLAHTDLLTSLTLALIAIAIPTALALQGLVLTPGGGHQALPHPPQLDQALTWTTRLLLVISVPGCAAALAALAGKRRRLAVTITSAVLLFTLGAIAATTTLVNGLVM